MVKYTDEMLERLQNMGTEKSGMSNKEYEEKVRRICYLRNYNVNTIIREYIYYLIRNVFIETDDCKENKCRKMINDGSLNGCCWQTNTFLAPFMNYSSFVCRGIISFYPGDKFEHSWLEISILNDVYVFDPCLNFLCHKDVYEQTLESKIYSKISSMIVREELIKLFENTNNDSIYIEGTNDFNDVFFRTDSNVYIKRRNNRIILLKAKFYEDC